MKNGKKHYSPIWVSERLEIVPAWETEYKSKASHTLLIEPGMGFGTGSHETTFLCLKLFSSLKSVPFSVLDFGAGSGILGLAADRMGMAKVLDLYDIDPEAMKNARVNTELNQLGTIPTRYLLPKDRNKFAPNYDVVFANILLPVLKAERDNLLTLLSPQGHLILSGILNEQSHELKAFYASTHQVQLVAEESKNDWTALMYKRR